MSNVLSSCGCACGVVRDGDNEKGAMVTCSRPDSCYRERAVRAFFSRPTHWRSGGRNHPPRGGVDLLALKGVGASSEQRMEARQRYTGAPMGGEGWKNERIHVNLWGIAVNQPDGPAVWVVGLVLGEGNC